MKIIVPAIGILIVLIAISSIIWAVYEDLGNKKCNMEHTIYKYDESNRVIETIKYTTREERNK